MENTRLKLQLLMTQVAERIN